MKRAVLYLRVAQRDHNTASIDRQRRACERFARERGWQIDAIYDGIGTPADEIPRTLVDLEPDAEA